MFEIYGNRGTMLRIKAKDIVEALEKFREQTGEEFTCVYNLHTYSIF